MQAWHTRTAHCLHEEAGLAKHAHLGGCLSGACFRFSSPTRNKENDALKRVTNFVDFGKESFRRIVQSYYERKELPTNVG